MKLTVLGSESAGNGYILESSSEVLVMEAGLRIQVVKQALNYHMNNVVGCLCTHSHGDHFKYHKDFSAAGINIYANDECSFNSHRFNVIQAGVLYNIGEFKVIPFLVHHGVKCFGFYIRHAEMGNMVFITDAAYVHNKFANLNHILIEANYSDEAMVSDRAVGHHMSLATTMQFLKSNDLSKTYNVILLHLSSGSSDSKQFITSVKQIAPNANVMVADKGLEVNLINNPF